MATIIRAAVSYWFLLFIIRIVGRRTAGQLTSFELILIFLSGGMLIQSIVFDDRSLTNAILAVMTLGLMHVSVAFLKQRYARFGRIADGTPIVLLSHGEWHSDIMERARIQPQDIMAAARGKGLVRLEQIKYAILERNGNISIVEKEDQGSQ
jgi:uncharacterized membrane protein YcaP (DUF421 family)